MCAEERPSTWNQMSSGQPWAINSSSLEVLAFVQSLSLREDCCTLEFVLAYVDRGRGLHSGAGEVVDHFGRMSLRRGRTVCVVGYIFVGSSNVACSVKSIRRSRGACLHVPKRLNEWGKISNESLDCFDNRPVRVYPKHPRRLGPDQAMPER